MIGSGINNDLQLLSLIVGIVCQSGFLLMYARVEWYVNYVGRALMAKSASLLFALIVSVLASMSMQTPYTNNWISPLLTMADWTLTLAIALQWRALWRQQHSPEGELS